MLSINSNVRFPNLQQLNRKAKSIGLAMWVWEQDDRGFYFTEVEYRPEVAAIIEAQDAKAREAVAKRIATGEAPKPAAKRTSADGVPPITAQIRAWVHDHPQATKADALRHFSDLNPPTVGVQFGKARKGEL